MRRHAKASSAGSNHGTGSARALFRRGLATRGASGDSKGSGAPSSHRSVVALTAALMLTAALTFGAGTAVAADPTFTVGPASGVGYTTAHVSGTIDPGDADRFFFFQYAPVGTEEWKSFSGVHGYQFAAANSGSRAVGEDFFDLTPGTEYKMRLFAFPVDNSAEFFSSLPYVTFTTKSAAKPPVTFDPVSAITKNGAHVSATVGSGAPAGPLTPEEEAVYRAEWHFECFPTVCEGLPSGVVEAGEPSQTISADARGLEANLPYEVKLVATNAAGVTTVERTFKTVSLPPLVKTGPGASDGKGGYFIEGAVTAFNSKITDCHFNYGPTAAYVYVAPCSPLPAGRDEKQRVRVAADAGQFRLSFRGQSTGDITALSSAALVQAELEALPSIGASNVTVTVGNLLANDPYEVTFVGSLAALNVPQIQAKNGTVPLTIAGGQPGGLETSTLVEGENNKAIVVEAYVTDLSPGATYHFQLVATNSFGTVSSADAIFVPTLAPPAGTCPNEALRVENNSLALPECRAYEQISYPAKTGNSAVLQEYTENGVVRYSSRASFLDSGTGWIFGGNYVSVRSDAGWKTIPSLNGPTGSLYTGPDGAGRVTEDLNVYSSDLRSSLWKMEKVGGNPFQKKLYLRNPDGSFSLVGDGGEGGRERPGAWSNPAGASADLSHIIVNGRPGAFGSLWGTGLYEFVGTDNAEPRRVDVDNSGDPISGCIGSFSGNATGESISRDGSVIYFKATGGPCAAGGPPADEIWARVDGTTSYAVSQSHCTRTAGDPGGACNAPANARFQAATPDGSRVFFDTTQQLVNGDTDQTDDLYAYDLPTPSHPAPVLSEVSDASSEAKVEQVVRTSDDGSTAYFVAAGVLAANDDAQGESAVAGDHNLYVWRRDAGHPAGQTKFIGRLLTNDVDAQTTADGRYLIFTTDAPLGLTDTDNSADVYRYDSEAGKLIRVSTNVLGVGGNVDGVDASLGGETGSNRTLSSASKDAEEIVFATDEPLAPAVDGNGSQDVYLWNAGRVSLITPGAVPPDNGGQNSIALNPSIDGSGQNVYFSTKLPLTPTDADIVGDVYDARVGGGFSAAEATPCAGEACQAPLSGSPAVPSAATASRGSDGNVQSKRCPKGKVARGDKCVTAPHKKPHKKKGKRNVKRASHNRGGSK